MKFSTSSLTDYVIEAVILVMVEESVLRYVSPKEGKRLETELIPVLLAIMIRTSLLGLTMKKCSGSCKTNTLSALVGQNAEAVDRIQGKGHTTKVVE